MRRLLKRLATAIGSFLIEVGTIFYIYGGEFKRQPKTNEFNEPH